MTRFKVRCVETVETEYLIDVDSKEKDPAILLDEWLESGTAADVVSTKLTSQVVKDRDFAVAEVPPADVKHPAFDAADRSAEADVKLDDRLCTYVVEEPPKNVMERRTMKVEWCGEAQ